MVLHYLGLDHIGHKAGPKRFVSLAVVSLISSLTRQKLEYVSQAARNGRYCQDSFRSYGVQASFGLDTPRPLR